MTAGFNLLVDKVPTLAWLVVPVACVGYSFSSRWESGSLSSPVLDAGTQADREKMLAGRWHLEICPHHR